LGRSVKPIAFEVGTTAPEMMLFRIIRTRNSRIPSMSGGAATKAMMYTDTAVNSVGIMINTEPTYV
jgi:hypothetical protein